MKEEKFTISFLTRERIVFMAKRWRVSFYMAMNLLVLKSLKSVDIAREERSSKRRIV